MQEARFTGAGQYNMTFLPICSGILYPDTLMQSMMLKLKKEKETELHLEGLHHYIIQRLLSIILSYKLCLTCQIQVDRVVSN